MLKPLVMSFRLVFTSTFISSRILSMTIFHRLAAYSLGLIKVELGHQRLERTAARYHLRDTAQLPSNGVFRDGGNYRSGQSRRCDNDER